jgi:transposase
MDTLPQKITDEAWAVLEPVVEQAKRSWRGRKPELTDRDFLEALLYLADAGCKWRQLPASFGDWSAVYNRYRRWLAAGVFDRIHERLVEQTVPEPVRRLFVDSTVVRAHQHAAGAPRTKGGRRSRRWAGAGVGSRPRST